MHQGFKNFLLEDAKKWNKESRDGIAKMLKNEPEQLKANIQEQIIDWGTAYCLQEGDMVQIYSTAEDADELMEAWREFLKEELAALD